MNLAPGPEFKDELQQWANGVVGNIKAKAPALGKLRARVKTKYDVPDKVVFSFPKEYVYREKGVGKYRKIGSGKEKPKPDITTGIEAALPQLGDIAAEGFATIVVRNLFPPKT